MNTKDELFIVSQFFYGMACCIVLLLGIYTTNEEDRKTYSGAIAYSMLNFGVVWALYWYLNDMDAFLLFSSLVGSLVGLFSIVMYRIYAQDSTPKYAALLSMMIILTSIMLFLYNQETYLNVLGDISFLILIITPLIDEYIDVWASMATSSVPLSLKIFLSGYAISWECYRLILPHTSMKTFLLTLASVLSTSQLIFSLYQLYHISISLYSR